MAISIDSLLTSPTAAQVQADFETAIENLGVPIKSWPKGGTGRSIVAVCASMYAAYASIVATVIRSAFLETSAGGWLTYVAFFVYGVTRIDATFATGNMSVTNGSASPVTRAAGTMQFLNPTTGKVYTNTGAVTIPTATTVLVPVQAVELGSASTSGPGAISALQTAITGVTVTNLVSIVGTDPELDAALKARCLAKLGTLSPLGPRDAYRYACLSATRPDNSNVGVTRVQVIPSPANNGLLTVIVASATGSVNVTDFPYITAAIEKYARPDTVRVALTNASAVPYNKTVTIWVRSNQAGVTDVNSIASAASTALTQAFAAYPLGGIAKDGNASNGYLWSDFVTGTVKATNPNIFDIDLSDASDVPLPLGVPTNAATFIVRVV